MQPKQIKDVREFIGMTRRKDAARIRLFFRRLYVVIKIKKNATGETKFKVRCSKVR